MSTIARRAPRRFTATAVASAALLAGALVGLTTAPASAHAAPAGKPTVVLVHGAWADSGAWDTVVAHLQRDGYPVDVFPTPLRTLAGDSAALEDYLAAIAGPVVLVGHSYGGAVITDAATGNANVKALVYLDAFAPDQGVPVINYVDPTSAVGGNPVDVFDFVGSDPNNPDLYVKKSLFPAAFANDLPKPQAAILAATQRPIALAALTDPSTAPAWATIPSWYEVGSLDKVIPPATQLATAQRIGAHVVQARTGHLPMVSQPGTVTQTIEAAAAATS
jgi:pimeloyl-ACP methyl ester carboxylesterase